MPACVPLCSSNGTARLRNTSALLSMMNRVLADLYHPDDNPKGTVSLGVAENSLLSEELKEYFDAHLDLDVNDDFSYGSSLKGSRRLCAALQKLYASPHFNSCWTIETDEIILGSGIGALLDQCVSLLCDRGDAVLLSAPFYAGFNKDITARNGAIAAGVHLPPEACAEPSSLEAFETKLESLRSEGIKTRAILLCNPHNPLGFCYPKETLIEYCRFAEKHDIFIIADEVYAQSVFESDLANAKPFVSILSIDIQREAGCDPRRLLHLYGASKDFGINGFRIGAMLTKNEDIREGFTSAAMWLKISSPADALFSSLLNDAARLEWYIGENKRRLAAAYKMATDALRAQHVPYMPSNAGHFLMIDLSAFMPPNGKDSEREAALFLQLLEGGVYVAPGAFYHYPKAGAFRLTFSVAEPILRAGLERMFGILAKARSEGKKETLDLSDVARALASTEMACMSCVC